jgi:hypothetical protein
MERYIERKETKYTKDGLLNEHTYLADKDGLISRATSKSIVVFPIDVESGQRMKLKLLLHEA